ncbi:pleiotropic drug resistance protein 2-like isoform X1 [Asparagus officinalis]|uniref:pleiotropic drug resistance protein 2-like isoform X1 n=1 Tax=Asparagus officinalis TaxID=4686 RepID=UPI00098E29B9|nr:pleiotropic drug resistance protein 2-like isoform X1 [Asparagus officinalis]
MKEAGEGKLVGNEVDIQKLSVTERKILTDHILKVVEEDNEHFLHQLKARTDRVGIELPKIEVRFEDLLVEADTYINNRAVPTLLNSILNIVEGVFSYVWFSPSKKKVHRILSGVNGIIKPSRMTLLLGPPASGKTTLLLSLAGKLDKQLRVSGKITYCGHEISEFSPQRTCAYISQHDLHHPEMTVRETLDFSGRCLGVGIRYDLLSELSRREKEAGIQPDPQIDAYMKSTAMEGQKTSLATNYILQVLGLDVCADIIIGDEMIRGISGGQKKRVTTGEMLAGPARAVFMDEISTGLDSSTTFQIVKFLRQMVHVMDGTILISLLQPPPETFELFDDIILLSDGQIVYHGPRETILEFFEFVGFKCPERKGVADFLQEATSKKDQEQYWYKESEPYRYISVPEFAQIFKSFLVGQRLSEDLKAPYEKSKTHPAALATENYGISSWELFKACLSREWLLMKRNSFLYIFKTTQITIMSLIGMSVFLRTEMRHETIADGGKYFNALFYALSNVMFNGVAELAMTIFRLPVFYKQRDSLFFPAWAFGLSYWILKIPLSLIESGIWVILTYYAIGFAPAVSRFFCQLLALFATHQVALSVFRFIAAAARTLILANTFGNSALLIIYVLGGFLISRGDIQSWWKWGYWISPMQYGQTAIAINEFLDPRWNTPNNDTSIDAFTIGKAVLKTRGIFVNGYWYWISIGALLGLSVVFNACFILALTYLNPVTNSQTVLINNEADHENKYLLSGAEKMSQMPKGCTNHSTLDNADFYEETNAKKVRYKNENSAVQPIRRGMILPFQPLSLAFSHVNYSVDMPAGMVNQGIKGSRLKLLCDVSGAFRPGILTALVGVSGAGKTTLMDVLAGRKTGGYIEGSISISGYPKRQETFARVSGYCEQNDIHSPQVTVYESLTYSSWLRLAPEIDCETRKMIVEEVMELVELNLYRDALVGCPGKDGLSTGQRKRLTVAVELVANPSIIFMDEPTTGLDARAAAIVMRTIRNTVNTGRTVVCTIHQPSIDIFESFDELMLMKRGGKVMYAGDLGHNSQKLIDYFEAIPGVARISEGCNPATWMLDISSPSVEARLGLDFAELYSSSSVYQQNQQLLEDLSRPASGSKDIYFPTKYNQSFITQFTACFWKQHWSYWRNPRYNVMRLFITLSFGLLFGSIYWKKGEKISKEQDLSNILGAIYAATFFLAASNAVTVQPVVAIERTVFYRERAAGMYSSLSYAFAQVCIEIVYVVPQSLIYAVILFTMIGFGPGVEKFFWFFYFIFMCFMVFTLFGMMVVSITQNHQIAGILSGFFFNLWNIFTGFVLPRLQIPIWWRWYYWATPLAWSTYGIVVSQLGEDDNLIMVPGEPSMSVKNYLHAKLGYEHSFLGYAAVAHVGFSLVFFLVFAFAIKYLNFQNR